MSGEHVLNSNKPQSVCPCSLCDSNLVMRRYNTIRLTNITQSLTGCANLAMVST